MLARGGGSIEDLWAFNDEGVARAISSSVAPVITGIGHETDFTIADFVSDLRAPTPTAAAELATPNQIDLKMEIGSLENKLNSSIMKIIDDQKHQASLQYHDLALHSPFRKIQTELQRLDDFELRANFGINRILEVRRIYFAGIYNQLVSLDPNAILKRGYAVVKDAVGSIISSTQQVEVTNPIMIQLSDGELEALVTKKREFGQEYP